MRRLPASLFACGALVSCLVATSLASWLPGCRAVFLAPKFLLVVYSLRKQAKTSSPLMKATVQLSSGSSHAIFFDFRAGQDKTNGLHQTLVDTCPTPNPARNSIRSMAPKEYIREIKAAWLHSCMLACLTCPEGQTSARRDPSDPSDGGPVLPSGQPQDKYWTTPCPSCHAPHWLNMLCCVKPSPPGREPFWQHHVQNPPTAYVESAWRVLSKC